MEDSNLSLIYYHSPDPLRNLFVRIRLRKIDPFRKTLKSFQNEESAQRQRILNEIDFVQPDYRSTGVINEWETDIHWQEKILGPKQVEKLLTMESNEQTVLDQHYLEQIEHFKEERGSFYGHKVYTYTSDEQWISDKSKQVPTTSRSDLSHKNAISGITEKFSNLLKSDSLNSQLVYPKGIQKDVSAFGSSQVMFILVSVDVGNIVLGSDDADVLTKIRMSEEHVLCRIVAFDDNSISMRPGFSTSEDDAYTFKSFTGEVYEYRLENLAAPVTVQPELTFEAQSFSKSKLMSKKKVFSGEFTMLAPQGGYHLSFRAEILGATGFDGTIYLQYYIDLPQGWSCPEDSVSKLQGITQKCKLSKGKAIFGYPLEMELTYLNKNEEDVLRMPVLYFQICSVGSWSRVINEGYCSTTLPSKPGMSNIELQCWKPLGRITQQMREFFVGGSNELDDLSYQAIPIGREDNITLNKYGFKTTTTGKIQVRMNLAFMKAPKRLLSREPSVRKTSSSSAAFTVRRRRLAEEEETV